MKVLNWALPQSNTFGIAALYPRPKRRGFTAKLINMAINELILSGFLDKNHTITDNGVAVFCPLKKSSIKSCFTTFLRICNVKANDCLDEIISDFSKNYAGSKIVWAKREQDYFLKTLIPDFISNGYIEEREGAFIITQRGIAAIY